MMAAPSMTPKFLEADGFRDRGCRPDGNLTTIPWKPHPKNHILSAYDSRRRERFCARRDFGRSDGLTHHS